MARGVWSLWADLPEPARGELRAIYRDLRAEYRLDRVSSRRLARRLAKTAAEAWAAADAVSQEAAAVALKRRAGLGRRPSVKHVRAAAKRQGLQLQTLRDALMRLKELAGGNGHHGTDPLEALIAGAKERPR